VAEPGSTYHYAGGNTYVLGSVVHAISRLNLRDFLVPRLLGPLGIRNPQWLRCPLGLPLAAIGLQLRTSEITRITQLLLHEGTCDGQRLVPGDYIARMTTDTTDTGRAEPDNRTYGLYVWAVRTRRGVAHSPRLLLHELANWTLNTTANGGLWSAETRDAKLAPHSRRGLTPCEGQRSPPAPKQGSRPGLGRRLVAGIIQCSGCPGQITSPCWCRGRAAAIATARGSRCPGAGAVAAFRSAGGRVVMV
jgi:CubicO group peptidase (beta-lactamase class C family)